MSPGSGAVLLNESWFRAVLLILVPPSLQAKVFRGAGPQASGPLRGVHLPVGNDSEEVRASACAVQVYLRDHLPAIIREFFRGAQRRALIGQLKEVANQLSEIPEVGVPRNGSRCQLDYQTPPTTYQRKTLGLRILHNVHLWLKSFTED